MSQNQKGQLVYDSILVQTILHSKQMKSMKSMCFDSDILKGMPEISFNFPKAH